jgi:acyl-CoA reductase-like NAD-dependent aldehyde dehydrogenase
VTRDEIRELLTRGRDAAPAAAAVPSYRRAAILRRVRDGVVRRREEFVDAIVSEARKPIAFARAEVDRACVTLEISAEEATRYGGEILPVDLEPRVERAWCAVERFPKGLVAALTPFNFPLNLALHKVAPAIACGCPVALKPSPRTPGPARLLAEEIAATDWPAGAFALIECANEDAEVLWMEETVAVVSFTGSDAVGWAIKSQAPRKTVVLELGGNAGALVASDADLDDAARKLALSAFAHAGQVCIKVQRIFAERNVFPAFLERFAMAARSLPAGDLRDPATVVSPLIDESAARRVASWIAEAASAGATTVVGGPREGDFVPATVLTGVPESASVACREVFGPVAVVEPCDSFDEGLARINRSTYGLQAAVFTRDLTAARRAFETLLVGGVIVNDAPSLRVDNFPYGGVKASGFGREGVRSAIQEYTEPRVLVVAGTRYPER